MLRTPLAASILALVVVGMTTTGCGGKGAAAADTTAVPASRTPAEVVDYWSARTVFRPLSIVDRQRLILMLSGGDAGPLPDSLLQQRLPLLVALLFDSPYFEWR